MPYKLKKNDNVIIVQGSLKNKEVYIKKFSFCKKKVFIKSFRVNKDKNFLYMNNTRKRDCYIATSNTMYRCEKKGISRIGRIIINNSKFRYSKRNIRII